MRRWGFPEDAFETVKRNQSCLHDYLPGTILYWTPPDYWTGEQDYRPAHEELGNMRMVKETNWDDVAREDFIRYRFRKPSESLDLIDRLIEEGES